MKYFTKFPQKYYLPCPFRLNPLTVNLIIYCEMDGYLWDNLHYAGWYSFFPISFAFMNNIFILLELWQLLDNVFSELRTTVFVVNVWVPWYFFKLSKYIFLVSYKSSPDILKIHHVHNPSLDCKDLMQKLTL